MLCEIEESFVTISPLKLQNLVEPLENLPAGYGPAIRPIAKGVVLYVRWG
jgi:hypothetical protein